METETMDYRNPYQARAFFPRLRPGQSASAEARREAVARQAARIMRSYVLPGVAPMTCMQRVILLVLAVFMALVLFGLLGLFLPPPR
jgi:hypothetical protein